MLTKSARDEVHPAVGVTAQRLEPDGPIRSMSLQNRLGPKLLVSDVTTLDRNVLRWRLRVTGNMAVEFGMVPTNLAVGQYHLPVMHHPRLLLSH